MAQYQPGDVVTFYDDPLTETSVYGDGVLKEKVSAKNFEGLETWIAEFYIDDPENTGGIETRQILSQDEDEIEQAVNNATNPSPVPQPTGMPISYKTLIDKPTNVEEAGLTNAVFIGKSRPITNSPITPGTTGEIVLYGASKYFCIGNNLWVEFQTISVP
jgi:hypothetical protein